MPGKYEMVKAMKVKDIKVKARPKKQQNAVKLILTCDHKLTFATSINGDHQLYKMHLLASPVRPTSITVDLGNQANSLDLGNGRVFIPRKSLVKIEGDGDYVKVWRTPVQGELTLSPMRSLKFVAQMMDAFKAIDMETSRLRLPVSTSFEAPMWDASHTFPPALPFDGGVYPLSFDQLSSRLNWMHLNGSIG